MAQQYGFRAAFALQVRGFAGTRVVARRVQAPPAMCIGAAAALAHAQMQVLNKTRWLLACRPRLISSVSC